MGIAAGLPHVAAGPSPLTPPHPFCIQWRRVGGWADAAPDPPPRPHPRPEPFIRPRVLNKGRAGPDRSRPEFQDLAPIFPSTILRASTAPFPQGGEVWGRGEGWSLFLTKGGTGNRGASPLGLSGKQLPAEAAAEPCASWPRVAGRTLKDRPVLHPVGGWVDATILENLGGTHGLGGALQLRDVAPIRSVPTEPVPLGVPA